MAARKNSSKAPPGQGGFSPGDLEDQREVALIRRTLERGGKTFSHAQVMRELGFDDLATPVHKRRSRSGRSLF